MATPRVAVVFGSDSDWPVMQKAVDQLRQFNLEPHVEVMSAHRTPARVEEFATGAADAGYDVIIAGAGMSAALAGTISAHATVPVIGVPLASGDLQGLDALLSTVQMPPGVPVAGVGIGAAGARNAALIAVQILARSDAELHEAYRAFKKKQAQKVTQANAALQEKLSS